MTSLAIVKLVADGLLFLSVSYLALKVIAKNQSNTTNLAKFKELEEAIRASIREADDAGRNLSDELISRKRDLEKILSEVEGLEGRISKQSSNLLATIDEARETQQELARKLRPSYATKLEEEAPLRQSKIEDPINYNKIPEPPSFASQNTVSRKTKVTPAPLKDQIEKKVDPEDIFARLAEIAEKTIAANKLSEHKSESATSKREIRTDPRLGVLGGLRRTEQTI